MAGKSAINDNFAPGSPATRYNVSGKNREFYTFENAPGIGAYATGGTIIDGGDGYIYHIFTGDGTFAVNRPSAAIDSVDYLIVAGGGAITPGAAPASGGAGGGGMLFGNTPVTQTTYPIAVGGGGPSVANSPTTTGTQRNGSPSTAFALTATGGGSGGNPTPGIDGRPGGSGGGSAFPGGNGGTGNTPATIPRQGYNGVTPSGAASGGGGAGGLGVAGGPTSLLVGAGGPGRIAPEFPSTIVRKAIPAPLLPSWEPLVGSGGYAAGGAGTSPPGTMPAPLTRSTPANSGYGGQGGGSNSGGSGIVCIRYKKTAPYTRATGGTVEPSTHPEHIGVVRHIFTGPGTFAVTDPTLQYVDYLAVGGGGGGGHGGGGAGGFVSSIHTSTTTPTSIPEAYPWNPGYSVRVGEQYPVGVSTYPIGIGTGGNAATVGNNTTIGNSGPSQFIAAGGGAGVAGDPGCPPAGQPGGSGGSGGGAATRAFPPPTPGLTGTGGTATPSPSIQGNAGAPFVVQLIAGGGGGGGAAESRPGNTFPGGSGWYSVLSPSAYGTPGPLTPNPLYRYFAGGGAGNYSTTPYSGGSGGGGGGGPIITPGTVNTGGGGGGFTTGGTGGPGIVIIQYPEQEVKYGTLCTNWLRK